MYNKDEMRYKNPEKRKEYQRKYKREYMRKYRKMHPTLKRRSNGRRKDRRNERKKLAIKLKGGKCSKCGYNKNYAALVFHHKNSDKKKIEKNFLVFKKKKFLKTLEKLELVCSNCHSEIHHPNLKL